MPLPQEWKDFFETYEQCSFFPIPPHNYDLAITVYKGTLSQKIYRYIAEDATIVHYKYIKWNQELQEEIAQDIYEYGKLHGNIYKVTNVAKYRSFQYRLLQRGLITNIQLNKWGLCNSRMCTMCGEVDETLVHLFWDCSIVQELWGKVKNFLKEEYGITELNMTPKNIIINNISSRKIANFICLITKQFIYRQRCLKLGVNFTTLKIHIRQIESIEKYIAVKSNKKRIHEKKWRREGDDSECIDYVNAM